MSFAVEVFPPTDYAPEAASRITDALPSSGAVVITGGTTAAHVYKELSLPNREIEIFFSDERCVPPEDDNSNFKMANDKLQFPGEVNVHRMRGELLPEEAAAAYHDEITPFVEARFELMLLGMGDDCHVGALFPGSPALGEGRYCAAVDRPDGMKGVTLTPPALGAARRILLLVTGHSKADAVRRVVHGSEAPETCPARLLADHPDATFLLDDSAASLV